MRYVTTACLCGTTLLGLLMPARLAAQVAPDTTAPTAMMTPVQFKAAGLAKLSPDELRALNAWLNTLENASMSVGATMARQACERAAQVTLGHPVLPPPSFSLADQGVPAVVHTANGGMIVTAQTPAGIASANREAQAAIVAAQQTSENQRLLATHGEFCAAMQIGRPNDATPVPPPTGTTP